MADVKRAKKYALWRHLLFIATFFYLLFWLILFVASGWSATLKQLSDTVAANYYLATALYFIVFIIFLNLVLLPLNFISDFWLEHRFGLANETVFNWLLDEVKGLLLAVIFFLPLGLVVYAFIRLANNYWWVYAAIVWSLYSVFIAFIAPVVIMPLFNKFEPLKDEQLAQEIKQLAAKARLNITQVLVTDMSKRTKKANAYFAGLGRTKRVVLGDTLVNNFTPLEILAVVAHELGHWSKGHINKNLWLNVLVGFFSFYAVNLFLNATVNYFNLGSKTNVASFPLLVLGFLLISAFLTPALNAVSRYFETEADLFELKLLKQPEASISCFKKLGEQNLADPEPHPLIEFLFYSHPSLSKRIKLAESFLPS
jgi:STE24 endopeptidase